MDPLSGLVVVPIGELPPAGLVAIANDPVTFSTLYARPGQAVDLQDVSPSLWSDLLRAFWARKTEVI